MVRRILDTNVLINFWRESRGDRRLVEISAGDARRWAQNLLKIHNGDVGVVTPVVLEFLCGVKSSHDLKLARSFLSVFELADEGDVSSKDWEETQRLAQRVPRDGKPRHLVDCLIRSICKRLKVDVLTGERRFVGPCVMPAELYISTDCETDGPIPGPHSMLSFASAAFTADKKLVSAFSANLELLPDAVGDPKTMAFWQSQPDAWEACRKDVRPPRDVMPQYVRWLKGLGGKPVFVGYPVAFDFLFVYWYLIRFAGESPFSHSALDIKTMAMLALDKPYRDSTKKAMPKRWFEDAPHTHVALDDAIGQGLLFCNILAEMRERLGGAVNG